MQRQPHRRLMAIALVLLAFILASCNFESSSPPSQSKMPLPAAPTDASILTNYVSTVSFTALGGIVGSYSIRSAPPISMLRHGHQEFTIDLTHTGKAIFLAFFGYMGPGTYKLSHETNGGDVRITFGSASWDLSLNPKAYCTLTISSDTPTSSMGVDKMRGSFSCPMLTPSAPGHAEQPITVHNGTINVFIMIVS